VDEARIRSYVDEETQDDTLENQLETCGRHFANCFQKAEEPRKETERQRDRERFFTKLGLQKGEVETRGLSMEMVVEKERFFTRDSLRGEIIFTRASLQLKVKSRESIKMSRYMTEMDSMNRVETKERLLQRQLEKERDFNRERCHQMYSSRRCCLHKSESSIESRESRVESRSSCRDI
jgi:hypothetical protein